MKIKKIETCVRTFGIHVLTAVAGLALLLYPDGATALMTSLLGWILVAYGAAKLIVPVTNRRRVSSVDWVWNGLCILAGVVLLSRPLILADLLGRVLGVMILAEGLRRLRDGMDLRDLLSIGAGVILLFLPRTLTNTVLALVGVALMIVGIINIVSRVRQWQCLEDGDPNIIDAL